MRDDMQKDFELWCKFKYPFKPLDKFKVSISGLNDYTDVYVRAMWEAWQAAHSKYYQPEGVVYRSNFESMP